MLGDCLRKVWARHRKPETFTTKEEERYHGLRALDMLTRFSQNFDCSAIPLAREQRVTARLRNGVELVGRIDRLDETVGGQKGLSVIDYKTGERVIDRLDLPDEPAASTYLLAAESSLKRPVEQVRFIYLASGAESRWEPEREDIDDARERLLEVTWQMHTDRVFEARPGHGCNWCPYASRCSDASTATAG